MHLRGGCKTHPEAAGIAGVLSEKRASFKKDILSDVFFVERAKGIDRVLCTLMARRDPLSPLLAKNVPLGHFLYARILRVRFPSSIKKSERNPRGSLSFLERAKGIEPSYSAWEADVLPLNYARMDACLL